MSMKINLTLFFFIFFIGKITAATYYVAPIGSDSNPGTKANPFKTIQKGADTVVAGDTVIVKDGIYTGGDVSHHLYMILINAVGTLDNWITFKSEKPFGAIIDGKYENYHTLGCGKNSRFIRIEGFEIKRARKTGFSCNFAGVTNWYLKGNKIHHNGRIDPSANNDSSGSGVYQAIGTSNFTYDGNTIYSNGFKNAYTIPAYNEDYCTNPNKWSKENSNPCTAHGHGIYMRGANNEVINNIFYDHVAGWALKPSPDVRNLKVINNTFSGSNPYHGGQIMLWMNTSNANILYQNNIFNISSGGVFRCLEYFKGAVTVKNNLIRTGGTYYSPISSTCHLKTEYFTILDNIIGEPSFSNTNVHDYSLTAQSVDLINSGLQKSAPLFDFKNTTRIGNPDIGAYEFKGGTTYYVSPTGLDSNQGTSVNPFKTIQKAANIVSPGDTVIVKDGIYTDNNSDGKVLLISRGGTSEAWVTFMAENKFGAVLDGNLNKSTHCVQAGRNIGHVKIINFEIKECANAGLQFANNYAGNFWEIKGNNIHDIGLRTKTTQWEMDNYINGHAGIYVGDGAENYLIDGNIIHHIGRKPCPECWSPSPGTRYDKAGTQKHEYHHDQAVYIEENVHYLTTSNNVFYENHYGSHFKIAPGSSNINFNDNIVFGPNQNFINIPAIDRGGALNMFHGVSAGLKDITVNNNTFYYPANDYIIWSYPYTNYDNIVNFVFSNNKSTSSKILDPRITSGDWKYSNNSLSATLPISQCLDGVDNDNDGLIDYPADKK